MQKEILALFGVCLAFAVGELLLPHTAAAGTKKVLRFLTSLVVLLLILTPFTAFLQNNIHVLSGQISFEESSEEDFDRIFKEAVREQSEKDIVAGLHALLEQEYDVKSKDCTILVSFDTDGTPCRISIFLSGESIAKNPETLERALCERLGLVVEVR